MDWKLLASTFAVIFVAEIGDKTQLATLSFAAGGSSRWMVFAGAALALVSTTAIAVLAGEGLSRLVSPAVLRRVAGGLFIIMGFVFLIGGGAGEDDATPGTVHQPDDRQQTTSEGQQTSSRSDETNAPS